jgi:hypothetical protein
MAELADALDLGSSSFGSAGSTPVRATLGLLVVFEMLASKRSVRQGGPD